MFKTGTNGLALNTSVKPDSILLVKALSAVVPIATLKPVRLAPTVVISIPSAEIFPAK